MPLFPPDGPAAVHQRCLDIQRPAVAMIVALQPGYEDLPLMAYLRLHRGATTAVVFLTNGEGTPGDTLGRYPSWMTGERKLEADRIAAFLDAEAWFANIPDLPGAGSSENVQALWDTVGAVRRLTRVIRRYKPDAVILCPDRRVINRSSARDTVALRALQEAVARAATTIDTSRNEGLLPWTVSRVFVQTRAKALPHVFMKNHPLVNATSLAIAQSAGQLYRTLRLRVGEWLAAGREYRILSQQGSLAAPRSPEQLVSGLPDVSPRMKSIERAIQAAVTSSSRGVRSASLLPVSRAIDLAEQTLTRESGRLTRQEQRLMATWKNGLEDLRSTVLGVSVTVEASESLLTASQLFYLRVSPLSPRRPKGQTEIIFPLARAGDWTINDGMNYHFSLDSVSSFNILTPADVPFAVPASEYGLTQPVMSTIFPYVIVHKDPQREYNYMYQGKIRLHLGPRRSFALRTPLIYDDRSSPVIYELQNFSRDRFRGTVTLTDSSGLFTELPVFFSHKDQILTDTLYLPGDPPPGEGYRLCTLELSGKGGRRSITVHHFETSVDTTVSVGLLSTIDSSPLADALRVLRQPHELLAVQQAAVTMPRFGTIVVDRDLFSDTLCTRATREALAGWIRGGGHAVVFPQHGADAAVWLTALCGAAFAPIDPLPCDAPVTMDSPGLFSSPNVITPADWEGWVVSRAFTEIRRPAPHSSGASQARTGSVPLICTLTVGDGSITLVAADILSQLVNYHPGAHRLLANIVAYRKN